MKNNDFDHLIERIYDQYDDLVEMLVHRGLSMDDALDVTQEVLIKACNKIIQLRDPDKLRAWVRKIANREASKALKRLAAEREREVSYIANESTGEETDIYEIVPDEETVEDIVCRNEREERLLELIDSVGEEESAVFVLHNYNGYYLREIAGAMEVKESTVRSRHSRTRKKLQKVVGEAIRKGEL